MTDIIRLPGARDDTLWAVIAMAGKKRVIANLYGNRQDALNDCSWRAQQVAAYVHFLTRTRQPVPQYSIAPVRRAEIPKSWRPVPALGFLHGQAL